MLSAPSSSVNLNYYSPHLTKLTASLNALHTPRSTSTSNCELQLKFRFQDKRVLKGGQRGREGLCPLSLRRYAGVQNRGVAPYSGDALRMGDLFQFRLSNQRVQDLRRVLSTLSLDNQGTSTMSTRGILGHVHGYRRAASILLPQIGIVDSIAP